MTSAKESSPAQPEHRPDRSEQIEALGRVLLSLIAMLKDNPDIPVPWAVAPLFQLPAPDFAEVVSRLGLESYGSAPQVNLGGLWGDYMEPADARKLWLSAVLAVQEQEDRPL